MSFKKLSNTVLKELEKVFNAIDEKQVNDVINMIIKANRIFLAGVGREGLATKAFSMRLMHLGKEVYWVWDDTTPNMGEGDAFILTSGSGEIGHIHYLAEKGKKNGASIIVVTGTPDRKTPAIADQVLWVPACVYKGKDNVVPSIQPMGNLFEQSLLITFDLIIMLLCEQLNISYSQMSERHRNVE